MRVSFFHGLIILSILVLIDGVGSSVEVLSDNYIIKDGQLIHQYLVCVDSGSMSPDLNPGDLVVLEKREINLYSVLEIQMQMPC